MQIAVIGAGMAGLTAARALADAGLAVTVFDKGRGLGGRLAGRRGEGVRFDHGASSLPVTEPEFRAMLDASGAAAEWPAGSGEVVGVPSMNALIKPLAEGLDVRLKTRVGGLWRTDAWALTDEGDAALGEFGVVVSTVPSPQARALVGGDALLSAALDGVVMAPQWAVMLGWRDPPGGDFDVLHAQGAVDLVARMAGKPGRVAGMECWVAHASPQWSRAHLEADKADIPRLLWSEIEAAAGHALPQPDHRDAHRWRYSRTVTPLDRPFLRDVSGTLYLGGDWALGPDAEHAWRSGSAIAQAVLEDLRASG